MAEEEVKDVEEVKEEAQPETPVEESVEPKEQFSKADKEIYRFLIKDRQKCRDKIKNGDYLEKPISESYEGDTKRAIEKRIKDYDKQIVKLEKKGMSLDCDT